MSLRRAALAPLLILATASGLAAETEKEALVVRSLSALHQEDRAGALAACARLRERWPEDPIGDLMTANVYQTTMRDYRVRRFEAEFEDAIGRALERARDAVARDATAEAFFALGSARGYRAVHRFGRGEWFAALREALGANGDLKKAAARDPAWVDPLLGIALHDFWKSEKLGLGIGLFSGGRTTVVPRLLSVWTNGRYLRVEAAYSLQTVHLRQGRPAEALVMNDWLQERFPENPIGLYHRGLILEALRRPREALRAWDALAVRLGSSPFSAHGFLAECHLHRARLHLELELRPEADDALDHAGEAEAAVAQAQEHAARRDPRSELEGQFERFEDIRKSIARLTPPARPDREAQAMGLYAATWLVTLASGFVPVVNSEVYLLTVAALHGARSAPALVLAATLGQMTAKSILFLSARAGLRTSAPRHGRLAVWSLHLRRGPRGWLLVFVSAFTGFPPFYAISLATGALGWPYAAFAAAGACGRLVRFALVVGAPDLLRKVLP
jgi:membrane protein YqaA with SNARE-associated domain